MVFWGSKTKQKRFDIGIVQQCPVCNVNSPFSLIVQYRLHHINWFFNWVSNVTYLKTCDHCNNGHVVENSVIDNVKSFNAISVWEKYSWMALVGLLIWVVLISTDVI